jgi:hypothetical protein
LGKWKNKDENILEACHQGVVAEASNFHGSLDIPIQEDGQSTGTGCSCI